MPVFGAMTSNSEFEFLIGDSMYLMPRGSIAYQFYVNPGVRSMVSTVKDQGYTAVAMHPYPAERTGTAGSATITWDLTISWISAPMRARMSSGNYISDLERF